MFDAHNHIDQITGDIGPLVKRAKAAGVEGMIVAGVDPAGWARQQGVGLANTWHCFGLHPWAVAALSDQDTDHALRQLAVLLEDNRPVGLGETGLDYGRRIDKHTRPRQQRAFEQQLHLAKAHNLPVVLHIVRAHDQAIETIERIGLPAAGGMVHSFSGRAHDARAYARLGLHISFSGAITRPSAKGLHEAATAVPFDRLLVETDAPDQTPASRHPAPNEPAFLIDVVRAVANAIGVDWHTIATTTEANARRLFQLPTQSKNETP